MERDDDIARLERKLATERERTATLEEIIESQTRELYLSHEKTEKALAFLETIFESLTDPFIIFTPDKIVKRANTVSIEILGYSAGRPLKGVPAGHLFQANIDEILSGDKHQRIVETSLISVAGRRIPVLMSITMIAAADGTVTDIICIAKDISDRKKAEDKIKKAHRELEKR